MTSRRTYVQVFTTAWLACLALASAAALAGCTMGSGGSADYLPAPAVLQQSFDCPASVFGLPGSGATDSPPAASLAGSVPEGFVPEQVFLCRLADVEVDAVTRLQYQRHQLAGDFTDLMTALAVPSTRGSENQMCTSDMEIVPVLWLVNAPGDAIAATWPTDGCGKTRGKPDTQKAIDALTVVDVQIPPVPMEGK
ncbi:hypothetical protein JOF48_000036 [Arthrobacter stackebrandtii]|uniref:DUF3558 domain-containing protein n=1 Tax=Arthrobacter stackebrandtii TaxID=272161 RepID=A0ABS4YS62_9MICC|nr:hypothetical protein [Arthrobacter stackebrandtii]MBP2411237.1 hypothetical protein [Arthrobacter stackebrandtii]PYH00074.1 hypothetical protein CVV67_11550 [Arthrobacter stackebrandtii]